MAKKIKLNKEYKDLTKIVDEYNSSQGKAIDLGGYYRPDAAKCAQAMQPSATFKQLLSGLA